MYKLFHWLFGYDYIYWANTADSGIARVVETDDGPCYWRYYSTKVMDKADGSNSQVIWLTCSRSKYIKD